MWTWYKWYELAFSDGNSDEKNIFVLTMSNNINIGERTDSGIPLIFSATKEADYYTLPSQDFFNPHYTFI